MSNITMGQAALALHEQTGAWRNSYSVGHRGASDGSTLIARQTRDM